VRATGTRLLRSCVAAAYVGDDCADVQTAVDLESASGETARRKRAVAIQSCDDRDGAMLIIRRSHVALRISAARQRHPREYSGQHRAGNTELIGALSDAPR